VKPTFVFLLTPVFASAATEVYNIRPVSGALMELTVEKAGLLSGKKHLFSFTEYRGMLIFDRDAPDRRQSCFSLNPRALCAPMRG